MKIQLNKGEPMRSYKYRMYVWYDEENDGFLETDSLWELLKNMWAERHQEFSSITWTRLKKKKGE